MIATRDVIAELAGIEPGSRLDAVRDRRPQARDNAEASYRALFEPASPAELPLLERFAVATFVAGLHGPSRVHARYADELSRLASADLVAAVAAEIAAGTTTGPYGAYPPGPLSREDRAGLTYSVTPPNRLVLGPRLSAALGHTHLLLFRPREADPGALQTLVDAGISTTAIVTLSQLVAFLTFQIRVVAGFAVLSAAEDGR